MPEIKKSYRLDASTYLFRLATESVRLFSNREGQFATISQVVEARAGVASEIPANYKPDELKKHLKIIPTDGEIPVILEILPTAGDDVEHAIPAISKALSESISFASAISIMLFDYVVEENKTEVLTKLGLTVAEAREYSSLLRGRNDNVVPIGGQPDN